jgi:hypothetical protein
VLAVKAYLLPMSLHYDYPLLGLLLDIDQIQLFLLQVLVVHIKNLFSKLTTKTSYNQKYIYTYVQKQFWTNHAILVFNLYKRRVNLDIKT